VKFFQKSTFANAQLRISRQKYKVSRGLVPIGKTRFGTIYFAGSSIQRCLTPLRELCGDETSRVVIPVGSHLLTFDMPVQYMYY